MGIIHPKVMDMAEHIGQFIEYWGFKKVHGKIWTLIFLSPTPVDANYLKDNLQISKALASMSIKDLLFYNVIIEVEKEKPGTQKYTYNPDITQVILDVLKKRELKILSETHVSFEALKNLGDKKSEHHVDEDRLQDLGQMIATASMILLSLVNGDLPHFDIFEKAMTLTPKKS